MNEELKFLGKLKKKWGGGVRGGVDVVVLGFTSHQQLRSYGDGTSV